MAAGIATRAAQVGIMFVLQGVILFLSSGRLDWPWAWIFLGIYLLSMAVNSAFLLHTNPEIVAERGQAKLTRDWDKIISSLWALAQFLLIPLIAGLDFRFGWTAGFAVAAHIVGGTAFAAGLGLFGWAMITNAYFSTAVLIQSDRGQTVCKTGPYHIVRHPGYTGTLLQSLGMPLLLGSWWTLAPGVAAAILMTLRTWFEDRTLQAELAGYPDFVREVRYRLIPGIW